MRKRILIIEDNKRVLEILSFALGREGYTVLRTNDGLTGIRLAEEQHPDLIIVDLASPVGGGMPVMGNLDVCRSLREEGVMAQVLVFTLSDTEQDAVVDAGADDYIRKPFTMRELLAKIRVNTWHLEGVSGTESIKLQVLGRIAIDPDQVKIMKDGIALDLTQREFDLISFLAKEPGKVYTREDLMHQVWEYTGFVGDVRVVDVTIRRLREKIEDDPANPTIIITKRGRGYYLATSR